MREASPEGPRQSAQAVAQAGDKTLAQGAQGEAADKTPVSKTRKIIR